MPTTYTLEANRLYAGRIIKLNTPDGTVYGRTAYNPDIPLPNTGNDYDILPKPVLGMDGNIYALTVTWDGIDYKVELLRWVTDWTGAAPSEGAVVASAIVGGLEPTSYYNQPAGHLVPGGENVQAFFLPPVPGAPITVALSPGAVPQVFIGCDLPRGRDYDGKTVGLLPTGYVLGTGGLLA